MTLIVSCNNSKEPPAFLASLEPAGWFHVESTLTHDDFSGYESAIRKRLVDHRISFDPTNRIQEIDWASPRETSPAEHCNGNIQGIAILVHGLSDNAFSMRDLSKTFSDKCYIARTALLPGHGTRPGDMLIVNHQHWLDTIKYLAEQAATEHDRVVLVGFSIGAVVSMSVALELPEKIDAIIAIEPAYHISSYNLARFAPWLGWLISWIDKDPADDSMRYESMPTRGVAETVRIIQLLYRRIAKAGGFNRPWMMVQSLDDSVISPNENLEFIKNHGNSALTHIVNFYSDQPPESSKPQERWIPGLSEELNVLGLTHLAVHFSPENIHYGVFGDYRNCGGTRGRPIHEVELCENSEPIQYSTWNKQIDPHIPTALSTFNPNYSLLDDSIGEFLKLIE